MKKNTFFFWNVFSKNHTISNKFKYVCTNTFTIVLWYTLLTMTMHLNNIFRTLRFVSNKAEQTFLSAGSKEVTVWKLIWVAIISIICVVCFLASSNQLRNGNGNIYLNAAALFALLTCNISIVYFADQPTTQWWCRNFSMFGRLKSVP